jgi:hypothetical protein
MTMKPKTKVNFNFDVLIKNIDELLGEWRIKYAVNSQSTVLL